MGEFIAKGHHNLRLKDYDYSQAGAYFITICVQQGRHSFGKILEERMVINDAGRMIERWWLELANKFPTIEVDCHIVMPNHFHGIIFLMEDVVAALRGSHSIGQSDLSHRGFPADLSMNLPATNRPALGDVVDWFKTMTTNDYIRGVKEYGWPPFQRRFWQRNYYEHVIRSEESLNRIREYILYNPLRWHLDKENPDRTGEDEIERIFKRINIKF